LVASESHIRVIGYGAMVTEMGVGIIALIAACTMNPAEYLAINMAGTPEAVTAKATALGYPITTGEMHALAASVGETNMVGRTGGAPTFAVGMAHMFAGVWGGKATALWYHFAIMFEAMFILTAIDAGTRVGRFLVHDLLGSVWRPLGNTRNILSSSLATVLFVAAWGWFLYQGVIDPLGGINSLWPLFGIANQLLAVMALALGTTVLLKMGRARYIWVTLLPLAWLLAVTVTASLMKIFGPAPLGFMALARQAEERISSGGTEGELAVWHSQLTNGWINAGMTALFLLLVIAVVGLNVHVWCRLLFKREPPNLAEAAYIKTKRVA
jgi:carbon starvation protein